VQLGKQNFAEHGRIFDSFARVDSKFAEIWIHGGLALAVEAAERAQELV